MARMRRYSKFAGISIGKALKANPVYQEDRIDFDFSKALFKFFVKEDNDAKREEKIQV